ncbi:stage III sporulation protein AF [Calidifontibacillus oryziterrae]|uniref:stage III sporulation protein AF n=1 Tax=Calidifontibacillus oryziterrae TaxID=1191699 RepID=UPI0002EDB53B|nr:stage III sporulation protein AF [Calidifontibacillus oryziterrae]
MDILTSWITNIILFVLLAIVIDLLLPNSSIQKYTKMVISLLLIVIILSPMMKLFDSNMEEVLANMMTLTLQEKKAGENLIENKKKEIQALQRAYILEQMAVQMKSVVEEEFMHEYGMELSEVKLQFNEDTEQLSTEDLRAVHVVINMKDRTEDIDNMQPINEVNIDTSMPIVKFDKNSNYNMQVFLAEAWQLDKDKVVVFMEGGEM